MNTLETDGALPRSTHYLVHPVLFDVIGRINPAFLQRIDRFNIVGYDRPWRESGPVERTLDVRQCCVLKADVQGFAALMRSGLDGPVRAALEDAARRWAPPASIAEIRSGDAVLIAADDPVALIGREIARWGNHFADLDAAAEALADELRLAAADLYGALVERLRVRHGLSIRVLPVDVMPGVLRRLDLHARQLQLSELMPPASRTFALAAQVALAALRRRDP